MRVIATQSVAATANYPNLDADAIRAQQKNRSVRRRGARALIGVRNTTELNDAAQIALFNALESIESIVNDAENNRMISERYKPTGSKLPKTACMTVAERKAVREESMRDFGKRNL